jgi:hypothetical protein
MNHIPLADRDLEPLATRLGALMGLAMRRLVCEV